MSTPPATAGIRKLGAFVLRSVALWSASGALLYTRAEHSPRTSCRVSTLQRTCSLDKGGSIRCAYAPTVRHMQMSLTKQYKACTAVPRNTSLLA